MKKSVFLIPVACVLSVVASGQVSRQGSFSTANGNVRTMAVQANSRRLIAGLDNGSVSVFEIPAGDSWNLPGHPAKVQAMAVSQDNRYVAYASEDESFTLYDFQESKALKLNGAAGNVEAIAFSPAARTIATGDDRGKITLWEISSREKVKSLQGRTSAVLSLAFSSTGKALASGGADHSITIWDVDAGTARDVLFGHKDWVRAISFNNDGKVLASASYDKTVRLWDAGTGKLTATLQGHKDWVLDVRFSPDGKYLVSGGADGQAILWSSEGKVIQNLKGLSKMVCAVQFSNDGKYLVCADLSSELGVFNVEPLAIQPWKPFDLDPPAIVMISPRLLGTRDAGTGLKKAVVHQSRLRIVAEITDINGVRDVMIDGQKAEQVAGLPDRYQIEVNYPMNTERVIAIKATDNTGNTVEEKLIIENKRFSGTVDGSKYHALLIAVQDYQEDDITDLDQPKADMNRLRNVLLTHYDFNPENIVVLENPDRNALYAKFDEFQARMDKVDNLLIFYAGHGYWDEQLQQGYWLPSDAQKNKRSTWISNGALRDYIGGIQARHTLLLTDACFSGGIFKSRSVFENASAAIETLYLRKSRKAMTSGTLEAVPDKSVFIDYLIRRLEQNSEPYITAEELFSSLRKEVINNSPNNQVPQYGEIGQTGDEGGEFIFIRKN